MYIFRSFLKTKITVVIFLLAVPDVSTYQYEETSGYYYDATTGLYYDANSQVHYTFTLLNVGRVLFEIHRVFSQYYYNSTTQEFLYWDGEKKTYLPAPTSGAAETNNSEATADDDKKEKPEKKDKVKVAKRIAKVSDIDRVL